MSHPNASTADPGRSAVKPRAFTLELTKGCNLRCGYCYYADRDEAYDPKTAMSPEVAESSIELLLREGPDDQPLHLHFFGGEPLLNLPLLEHVLRYAERRGREEGKRFTFEVTTNGTLLSDRAVALLDEFAVHVGVSFDGPPEIQNVARPASGGQASWSLATDGIERLITARRGTPLQKEVHCTVVVTRRDLDLRKIARHLESLGFERIILAPATDLEGRNHALRPEDLPEVIAAYDALADEAEERMLRGEAVTVTWFPILLGRLQSGERKMSYCGGGQDYLGVQADGSLSLCYRFYEDEAHAMGSVQEGIDRDVTERLDALPLDARTSCSRCWARFFCGGGCHHENLLASGNLGDPNPVTCEVLRHGMDRTLGIWARLGKERRATPNRKEEIMTAAKVWSDAARPAHAEGCHRKEMDDETIVYVPQTHEVVVLNRTALLIFDLCDGERSVADLLEALKKRFDAPEERLRADLMATLDQLRQKGALA